MLNEDSSVPDFLQRVNFLTPVQQEALGRYLEHKTVGDLLYCANAQELANDIEQKMREEFSGNVAKVPMSKRAYELDVWMCHNGTLPLCEIGAIAYKLLQQAHRMFDPIPRAVSRTL